MSRLTNNPFACLVWPEPLDHEHLAVEDLRRLVETHPPNSVHLTHESVAPEMQGVMIHKKIHRILSVRQTVAGALVTYYQGSKRRIRKLPKKCIRSFYVETIQSLSVA
jgi:hypothetical protein